MGFSFETSVPVFTVFLQGLLSFLSPCVLPLVPLYLSYLAGGGKQVGKDGQIRYPRAQVLVNTLFFILGIGFTFFLLGFGFTALGQFFSSNRVLFARISGIIMVLFGLYQFGFFGRSQTMDREHRLLFRLDRWVMGPIPALLLGFTFSFAWTPCVGPVLGSVVLMAGSSGSMLKAAVLIGVYTLGFTLPFLAVGIFTTRVLGFFKRHNNVVKYTAKIGAALLILMGIMTFTGFMNSFTTYLSSPGGNTIPPAQSQPLPEPEPTEKPKVPAPDFTLTDQNGKEHTLSDYQGKTVFLNFWATWCPPCKGEMPDIQALYQSHGGNEDDLVVIGVAGPNQGREGTVEDITAFLSDNDYTFPVVMDQTGDVFLQYGITAFPTTFMIDTEGNVFGYVASALSPEMMESIVQQTMTGERTAK
ncbi:MAG: redoxin domain-containing protein [Clostridia bacterium]|nr:redoxin domain-containing protein [Clostridia bacterium]